MNKNLEITAVIPARGGSKGVPDKNIADIAEKPLIAWTIEAAKKSQFINRIIISTDSQKIADCAQRYGVPVPWLRSESLATDDSPVISSLIDVVERLKKDENYIPDYILVLQPTSPFRTSLDIDNVIEIAKNNSADTVVSVYEAENHPYLCKKVDDNKILSEFIKNPFDENELNRQNLPQAYALNGAAYLVKTEVLMESKSLYGKTVYGYVMPPERSLDIDTSWDMYLARLIMKDRFGL